MTPAGSLPTDQRDLLFIGDVHLDRDDADLEPFLAFLEQVRTTAIRVVLIGDLFNLWIGRKELEQPHQTVVIEKLEQLRRGGVTVRYLEGNRDYRIARAYEGSALDEAGERGIVERFGGRSLFAAHGDLVNRSDLQYRTWRGLSRTRLFWAVFDALPRRRSLRLAENLEARLRKTNLEHKSYFPERHVRQFAASCFTQGHDAVVLGHFHVEKDLEAEPPSPPGRILVLPLWKDSRRHLRVTPAGEVSFVDSPC